MSRCHEYINKPPNDWTADVERMRATPLFLMSTLGPTVFVIKQAEIERPFKVYIGDNQRCSCGGGEGRGALCIHLMYVMIKVLRVPDNNPLSWQLSLVDSEVTNILAGRIGSSRRSGGPGRTHAFLRRGSGTASSEGSASSRQADDGAPKRERKVRCWATWSSQRAMQLIRS
jgi:hypothetical protein